MVTRQDFYDLFKHDSKERVDQFIYKLKENKPNRLMEAIFRMKKQASTWDDNDSLYWLEG